MTPEELSRLREWCKAAESDDWAAVTLAAASRTALPQLLDEVERAREEVGFQMGIVRNLNKQVAEWERMRAHWTSRASKAKAALNEANKLLDQTIEVLEERIDAWTEAGNVATQLAKENGGDPFWLGMRAAYSGCTVEAKPLLDNLKALKKEAGS